MKGGVVIFILVIASCNPKLAPDRTWQGEHWIVTEMSRVPVQLSGTKKDAFLEFDPAGRRFTGNGGCNRISGNYTSPK